MADGAAPLAVQVMTEIQSPYAVPGQKCDDIEGRLGPCDGVFKVFPQCDAPFSTSTVWLKYTVSAPGANLVLAKQTPKAFSQGTGSSAADAGGGVFGSLIQADTIIGENNALGYGEGIIFRVTGLAVGFGRPLVATGSVRTYGTPWLDAYAEDMNEVALNEVSILLKHGSQNGDQWLGNLANWRPANLQDNLPDAGKFTALRCRDLSGAQQDSDKLIALVQVEQDVQIANRLASPTLAVDVYHPVKLVLYGDPDCRDKSGICAVPTTKEVDALKSRMNNMEGVLARIAQKVGA